MNEKRYKVVQDGRGYWGIWDREADDFASWGDAYHDLSGVLSLEEMAHYAGAINEGCSDRDEFEWDGEYLPRGKA